MLRCLRLSYYDRNPDSCIRCRVHCLLYDTSPTEVDETYRTRGRTDCVGNTRFKCIFNGHSGRSDDAYSINNSMKTISDIRLLHHTVTIPQGREPFHPRKQTGTFMSTLHHDERNHENKDRGLTSLSGRTPVDAPPC